MSDQDDLSNEVKIEVSESEKGTNIGVSVPSDTNSVNELEKSHSSPIFFTSQQRGAMSFKNSNFPPDLTLKDLIKMETGLMEEISQQKKEKIRKISNLSKDKNNLKKLMKEDRNLNRLHKTKATLKNTVKMISNLIIFQLHEFNWFSDSWESETIHVKNRFKSNVNLKVMEILTCCISSLIEDCETEEEQKNTLQEIVNENCRSHYAKIKSELKGESQPNFEAPPSPISSLIPSLPPIGKPPNIPAPPPPINNVNYRLASNTSSPIKREPLLRVIGSRSPTKSNKSKSFEISDQRKMNSLSPMKFKKTANGESDLRESSENNGSKLFNSIEISLDLSLLSPRSLQIYNTLQRSTREMPIDNVNMSLIDSLRDSENEKDIQIFPSKKVRIVIYSSELKRNFNISNRKN